MLLYKMFEILKCNMPEDLDKEPELTNLIPIESKFSIIDQKKLAQNLDKNQEKIACETCDKFVKVDVPCKILNN